MSSTGGGIGHEEINPSVTGQINDQLTVILAHCDIPAVEAAVLKIQQLLLPPAQENPSEPEATPAVPS